MNIPVIGTLKVLLLAKQSGILSSVQNAIGLLTSHNFRFSKEIVRTILMEANEL
jgi:predicted nucleic acid-binding protein